MSWRQQFVKFTTVGLLGTLVHYAILIALVEIFNISSVTATIWGSLAGAINNYIFNYYWTFSSSDNHWSTAPKFFMIATLGMLLNALLMWIFNHFFGIWYLISQVLATLIVLVFNFIGNRLLIFNKVHNE